MNYLIIGNSAAAIGAVEGIRKVDNDSPIIIISEETYLSYSRPLIAEYLSDTIDFNKMWYRDESFYIDNKVELKLNTSVVSINTDNKTVKTSNGNDISFDRLLIASGGTPFIPQIEGLNTEGVFTFVRWDEVKKIKQYKEKIKHAVVIGAGLIGLKATEHLTKAGVKVSLIELAPSILSLVIDTVASSILQEHFEAHGVTVYTSNTVERIHSSEGHVSGVTLKDGTELDCDAVVVAIGVVPNKNFLKDSHIETNRGIIVSETLQTNYNDIYAAGDVAEALDLLLEYKRVLPLWPVAYKQGYLAGLNMAGKHKLYDGEISMNSLEFFDLPIISAGHTKAPDDSFNEDSILNEKKKVYKKIIHKDNRLYGFIYLNNIDKAGILTGLIKEKTDISAFKHKILNDTFGLIDIPKEILEKKIAIAVSSST